jgi:photosystem II stability/assembly factor-like uncharacterized protein
MKRTLLARGGSVRRGLRSKDHGTESTRLDPKRAKRDRGEIHDELETFRRRAEWWRQYHGDTSGIVSGELRLQAIAHAEKLAASGLENPDPGGTRPKSGFELMAGPGAAKAKAARGQNPRPRSSFSFSSGAIEVRGPANLAGVVLKIALDTKRARQIAPATVRVFCLDDTSREWHLLPRSGAQTQVGYAWAHLHRPGVYIAIGLPADSAALDTVLAIRAMMPRLRAAGDKAGRRRVLELIGELLFPKGSTQTKAAAHNLDIAGLDLPERGLPEFDILEEICPATLPPFGKNFGREIIERIRWQDIAAEPSGLVSWFNEWIPIGPRNVSGRIKSLAIHPYPFEGDTLLAGAADGGVWLTQDGGGTWFPLMDQELSMAIGAVTRSGGNPAVIYAATGEDTPGWGPSYPGVGVYKSIDGGGTWTLLPPINSSRCTRVLIHPVITTIVYVARVIHPANADIVYVAGDGGLHKSIDGGESWTNVRTDHVSDAVMDPLSPDTIYAAVWNSGIFKTTDGGATWADFNEGLPTGNGAGWIKLAVSNTPQGSNTLVAKMGTDSGQVFTRRTNDPYWVALPGTHEPASYNEWTNLVAINPLLHNFIFAGGVGLQRSTDFGANFSQIVGTHSDHHEIVFVASTTTCYMACDGGVYRSTDNGASWTLSSTGLVATQLYSIGVSQTQPFLLGGATQDQGIIKTNGPADWTDTGAGNEGGFFIVDPSDSNIVYVTPWSGNLRRSTDGGSQWTTILNGITQLGTPPAAVTIHHLAVCPNDSNLLLCVGGNEVFLSTDQGDNWSSVATFPVGSFATRVAWYGKNTCYAVTNTGLIFRSTQQGAPNTWSEPYTDANKPPYGPIIAIEPRFVTWGFVQAAERRVQRTAPAGGVVFPFRQDLVYIAYSSGGRVYKSTDGGASWANASGSGAGALPNIPISALVIGTSDTVYAATDIGVFRTRDGGANWEPFNDGLPRVLVSGLVLRTATNTLYASTMGRGAFQRALS